MPARGASPLPKYVVDGTSRRLRPPLSVSPKAIAEKAEQLLSDPELKREMGEKAAAHVETRFQLNRFVAELEKVYAG